MARELLRSVEGRQLPNLGELAVYWPAADFTNIYDTTGFEFTDEPNETGGVTEYPELIEHDAEETALALLAAAIKAVDGCEAMGWSVAAELRAAISKATGSAS